MLAIPKQQPAIGNRSGKVSESQLGRAVCLKRTLSIAAGRGRRWGPLADAEGTGTPLHTHPHVRAAGKKLL